MNISNRTVSPKFRVIIASKYPNLKNNRADWAFLGYLMFGSYREEHSGKLLIPSELIARIEGKFDQWVKNNYVARYFLERFTKLIQPFKWSKWDSEQGLARIVTELNWPQDVADAISAERQKLWVDTGRVYLINGTKFTSKKQIQNRRKEKLGALELLKESGCKEAEELLDYMNSLPSNLFYKILANMPHALEIADTLPPESRDRQKDLLNTVLDQYQPFYKPTAGSTRIYAFNENLLGLQRNVRKALTMGWLECDLKSAQLAICAKTWQVARAQNFLNDGGNIWDSLFEHFGLEKNDETKRVFKTALYAIMFGAQKKKLSGILDSLGGGSLDKFLSHGVIKSMWRARTRQLSQIRKDKGAINYFGQFISLKDFSARSILAQLAQAYELALLYPVLELAKKDKRFQIVLWQHDGFSVHIAKPEDKSNLVFNMKWVVKAKAHELGINTELEVNHQP